MSLLFCPPEERQEWWRDPRVRILWYDGALGKWITHGFLPIDEAGPDLLAEMFGGGKWKTQVVAYDDQGKVAIRWARDWVIPGPYKPPIKELPGLGPRTAAAATEVANVRPRETETRGGPYPSAGESLNAALVGSVLDLLKAQREMVKTPVSTTDWGAVLSVVAPVAQAIILKMMDRNTTDPVLVATLHKLEGELESLQNKPGPTANAVTDVLESIERIVKVSSKVRKLAAGDEESTDPEAAMWSMGKKAFEALLSGQHSVPGSGTAPLLPGATVPGGPPQPPKPLWERILIRHGRDMLIAASRGVDPTLAADWTMNMIPSDLQGAVIELLRKPEAEGLVMQVLPDLAQYPQWVHDFVVTARESLVGEPEPEDETTVEIREEDDSTE
jgi:hypothetical protein